MCRSLAHGGRRCDGGHSASRPAQTARQRLCRARKALANAEASGDPAAISQARDRMHAAQQCVQAHRRKPTGGAIELTVPAGPPAQTRPLGGMTGCPELLTYPDGTRVVRKVHGDQAARGGYDTVALTDAEVLATHVLDAVGLRAPAVHRAGPTEVHIEYIDGRQGSEIAGYGPVPDAVLTAMTGGYSGWPIT